PPTAVSKARGILLFYPGCIPEERQKDEVRQVLRQAWNECGFPVRHMDEWIDRTDQCATGFPWRNDSQYGWVCDHDHSLRNPKWAGKHHRWTPDMLSAVAQLFSSL